MAVNKVFSDTHTHTYERMGYNTQDKGRFFNIIQPFQNTSVSKKKKDVTG